MEPGLSSRLATGDRPADWHTFDTNIDVEMQVPDLISERQFPLLAINTRALAQ